MTSDANANVVANANEAHFVGDSDCVENVFRVTSL